MLKNESEESRNTKIVAPLRHNYINDICVLCNKERVSEGLEFTSNGDGTCSLSGIGTCADTEIIIPTKSPLGDTVISIDDYAFSDCLSITSITSNEKKHFIFCMPTFVHFESKLFCRK